MSAPRNATQSPALLWSGASGVQHGWMEEDDDAVWDERLPAEDAEGDSAMPGPALRASIAALYAAIMAVGVVGNVALMSAVCRARSLRSGPNVQLCSLALGDAVLLLACVPVDAAKYFAPQWLFGEFGCKLIPYIQLTSVGVSVFTLTALSADRTGGAWGVFVSVSPQVQARRKLARTVLVLAALFAACWLPAHLLYLYRAFAPGQAAASRAHLLLTVAARALSFCGSCVNPMALYLLSDGFRAHLRADLSPCRRLFRGVGGGGSGGGDAGAAMRRRRRRRSTRLASVLTRATSVRSTSSLAGGSERRGVAFQLSVPDIALLEPHGPQPAALQANA
ncbi:neuromedin-B receptor-like [Petromyzon marinus]|uniref:neuromedin-B receptor-like n=1 Tax=Petromyzon marinus TaxID=7757 RepID=UPI003F6FBA4A